jgi:endonuclease/exonuclease/phosphatase (EEP) superfamily protein YafD
MGTFTVQCECGERFHVEDAARGRHIRCRRCGRVIEIGEPPAAESTAKPTKRSRSKRRARPAAPSDGARQPVLIPRTGATRLATYACWAYLAGVILVAVIMWGWGDRSVIGTVLLFMGRWVFLLPLAALVPAAVWLRRDLLVPLAVASIVVVGPIMGFRTGWRRLLSTPQGTPLRVVTYNAGGGAVLAQLLPDFLSRWRPDVLALQECRDALTAAVRSSTGWHQYVGRELCLLSRYPIREASVMDRSGLDRVKQSEEKEIGGAGYVVRFVLDGPRGPIRVANLHLETPRKGFEGLMEFDLRRLRMNTEIREIESHLARQWVEQGAGPLVVLGDFNTPVESRIFRRHWGHLTDAFSDVGTGLGMTKYNGWIRVRIDHVLTSDAWHVERVQMGSERYSDHRPLVVDLILEAR